MAELRMPSLGADMEVGTIAEWRIGPGDVVTRGQIVAVVSTEKSDIEIEVFEDGTVGALLVPEGEEVPVGTPIATIDGDADAVDAPRAEPPRADPPPSAAPPGPAHRTLSPLVRHLAEDAGLDLESVDGTGPAGTVTRHDVEQAIARRRPPPADGDRVRATPLARRRADEAGVDLATLEGTGPSGAVVAADVAGSAPPTAPPTRAPRRPAAAGTSRGRRSTADALAANRAALAEQMARSKREIPHYYLSTTIDLATATAWLAERNADRAPGERILPVAVLLAATARAALKHPTLNGHWIDGGHEPSPSVHLALAISLRGGGLVAPAIADAQDLTVDEVMARVLDLVARARAGSLRPADLTPPTITVTNLGDQGVDEVFGVITPPQVALVGFGRVREAPWAAEGMLGVHPVVSASLSGDHRASTGHEGARFLNRIDRLVQHPEDL